MPNLNPFRKLIETKEYIHSRTLRTNFWKKMYDTFFVFAGSFFNKQEPGIFDYVTLMISYAVTGTAIWLDQQKNTLSSILSIPFFITAGILVIVRYAAAALCTILVSPIVGLVQLFSKIKGDSLKTKVLSIQLANHNDHQYNGTLEQYLNQSGTTLDSLRIHASGTYNALILEFGRRVNDPKRDVRCPDAMGPHDHLEAKATLDLDNPEHKSIVDSLLQLNAGRLAHRIEKSRTPWALFGIRGEITPEQKTTAINTKQRFG